MIEKIIPIQMIIDNLQKNHKEVKQVKTLPLREGDNSFGLSISSYSTSQHILVLNEHLNKKDPDINDKRYAETIACVCAKCPVLPTCIPELGRLTFYSPLQEVILGAGVHTPHCKLKNKFIPDKEFRFENTNYEMP